MNSASAHTNVAFEPLTRLPVSINSPIVCAPGGVHALKRPDGRSSAQRRMNAARSRTSMYCSGSLALPGASTWPPRATRATQYVNRSVLSPGPTTIVRPHDRAAGSVGALDDLFAAGLEAAHRFAPVTSSTFAIGRLRDFVVLVEPRLRERAVHGNARHEDVVTNVVLEQVRAQLDVARHVAGVVDDHVPVAALQCVELAVAVADQRFEILEQPGIALATVEESDLMSARLQRLDEMRPEEAGAAEDEHAQLLAHFLVLAKRGSASQSGCRRSGEHLNRFASLHGISPRR